MDVQANDDDVDDDDGDGDMPDHEFNDADFDLNPNVDNDEEEGAYIPYVDPNPDRPTFVPNTISFNVKEKQRLELLRFLLHSKCSYEVFRNLYCETSIAIPNCPLSFQTLKNGLEKILSPLLKLNSYDVLGENNVRKERLNYVSPIDVVKFWMYDRDLSNLVVKCNEKHTHPYLVDLGNRVEQMRTEMEEPDYRFDGPETGLEFYESLQRNEENWRPRLMPQLDHSKPLF
jgi:hypothetical protein